MSFKKETPILYFEPRSSNRYSKRQYILLPTWCYRVVAPQVHQRRVNILEKAVLGMCRAGAFHAEEMGKKLEIGRDLAALIIKQLSDCLKIPSVPQLGMFVILLDLAIVLGSVVNWKYK